MRAVDARAARRATLSQDGVDRIDLTVTIRTDYDAVLALLRLRAARLGLDPELASRNHRTGMAELCGAIDEALGNALMDAADQEGDDEDARRWAAATARAALGNRFGVSD